MIFRNRKENLTLMLKSFVQSLYFFSVKATKFVNTLVSFDPFFLAWFFVFHFNEYFWGIDVN